MHETIAKTLWHYKLKKKPTYNLWTRRMILNLWANNYKVYTIATICASILCNKNVVDLKIVITFVELRTICFNFFFFFSYLDGAIWVVVTLSTFSCDYGHGWNHACLKFKPRIHAYSIPPPRLPNASYIQTHTHIYIFDS